MKTLKEELDEIKSQISKLEVRKKDIEKKLMDSSTDLIGRFRNWYNSSGKGSDRYIPRNPIIRKSIDDMDLTDRHRTYYIDDMFEVSIYSIMNDEASDQYQYKEDILLLRDLPVLLEYMKVNIDSFTLDW